MNFESWDITECKNLLNIHKQSQILPNESWRAAIAFALRMNVAIELRTGHAETLRLDTTNDIKLANEGNEWSWWPHQLAYASATDSESN